MKASSPRALSFLGLVIVLASAPAAPVSAQWFTKILRGAGEIGDAGGHAGKVGRLAELGALEAASGYVAKLPQLPKSAALAAHVTPEGHWKFVSREGEVFTAGNPEELTRVATTLAPGLSNDAKLSLYLSEECVFARRGSLNDLPKDVELHLVLGEQSFRLRGGATTTLKAELGQGLTMQVTDRTLFREAVFQLSRPLSRSSIRVLALEPGGPQVLSNVPRFDPATKAALIDQIDPQSLTAAMRRLKGQTVLLSGRVEDGALRFVPSGGGEQQLGIQELVAAAEASDVNLVIVNAKAGRQPGGRNWLWQRVEVTGLDEALRRASFADFLASLGAKGGELEISATAASRGRVMLSAVPKDGSTVPFSSTIEEWMSEITGNVVSTSVDLYARDEERQEELDARLIPGVPAVAQFAYLGGILAGLISYAITYPWWSRIWPPEARGEYGSRAGYYAARAARTAAYVLLFLPVAGFPALLWSFLLQVWGLIMTPFRAMAWLKRRLTS